MDKKRSGEGGFTLVELLIVIVILGILSAIVVLAIGTLGDKSKLQACKSTAKTVQTANDAYFATTGLNKKYAPSIKALKDDGLLKTDPSADWSYNQGRGTDTYNLDGAGGDCPATLQYTEAS